MSFSISIGELAQLARAPALHAGGQRFESVILHGPWYPFVYPLANCLGVSLGFIDGRSSLTYWKKTR